MCVPSGVQKTKKHISLASSNSDDYHEEGRRHDRMAVGVRSAMAFLNGDI